ncbi:hypothetical protein Hanom_Chr08g00724211 [Helianthus anomalus]
MSEKPINAELDKELRQDYLDHILQQKPYKVNRAQFKDWSTDALKEEIEIERMQKILNGPLHKLTLPNWKKYKQVNQNKALKLKRMREELVATEYGNARSVARWSESKIVETYKKLEHLREMDPIVPKKPVYLRAVVPQQTLTFKKKSSASGLSIATLNQAKRQKQMSEANIKDV